jgi:uncharacterized protein YhdP
MKLPRLRLSTLCLVVVIAALSVGIVTLMKRHHDEVAQLRAELAARNRIFLGDRISIPVEFTPTGTTP